MAGVDDRFETTNDDDDTDDLRATGGEGSGFFGTGGTDDFLVVAGDEAGESPVVTT